MLKLGRPDSGKGLSETDRAAVPEAVGKIAERVFKLKSGSSKWLRTKLTRVQSRVVPTLDFLSLEIASLMKQALDLWDSLNPNEVEHLRTTFQESCIVMLVYHEPKLLWALAGLEVVERIEGMAMRVASLGVKSEEPQLQSLQKTTFQCLRDSSEPFPIFDLTPEEQKTLLEYLRGQVQGIGELKRCMERLSVVRRGISRSEEPVAVIVMGEENEDEDEESSSSTDYSGGQELFELMDKLTTLQSETMWSADLDHVVRVLILVIFMLRARLFMLGTSLDFSYAEELIQQSLSAAGLASRYAKIILLAEKIMVYPFMAAGSTRDDLYGLLTEEIRLGLEMRLDANKKPKKASERTTRRARSEGRRKLEDAGSFLDLLKEESEEEAAEREAKEREEMIGKMKWAMTLLPRLARNTVAWDEAHLIKSGRAPKTNKPIYKVQTLHCAQKEAVTNILIDALVGLTYVVTEDTGNTTKMVSKKVELQQQAREAASALLSNEDTRSNIMVKKTAAHTALHGSKSAEPSPAPKQRPRDTGPLPDLMSELAAVSEMFGATGKGQVEEKKEEKEEEKKDIRAKDDSALWMPGRRRVRDLSPLPDLRSELEAVKDMFSSEKGAEFGKGGAKGKMPNDLPIRRRSKDLTPLPDLKAELAAVSELFKPVRHSASEGADRADGGEPPSIRPTRTMSFGLTGSPRDSHASPTNSSASSRPKLNRLLAKKDPGAVSFTGLERDIEEATKRAAAQMGGQGGRDVEEAKKKSPLGSGSGSPDKASQNEAKGKDEDDDDEDFVWRPARPIQAF